MKLDDFALRMAIEGPNAMGDFLKRMEERKPADHIETKLLELLDEQQEWVDRGVPKAEILAEKDLATDSFALACAVIALHAFEEGDGNPSDTIYTALLLGIHLGMKLDPAALALERKLDG